MDLHSTILGLLSWKPFSGYDLKGIISDSNLFYWSGNNNQIYKVLLELQRDGLVSFEVQQQQSLPAKKIYTINERGRAALRQSLLQKPQVSDWPKSFLIQLAWSDCLTDDEVLDLLNFYEQELISHLSLLQGEAERRENSPHRTPREAYLWRRIADNFILATQTELQWTSETRKAISEGILD